MLLIYNLRINQLVFIVIYSLCLHFQSNNSSHSGSSSPKPRQMQLLRRPDGATKPAKPANERGAFLKPTNQVKPTVKDSSKQLVNNGGTHQHSENTTVTAQRVSPKPVVKQEAVAAVVTPVRNDDPAVVSSDSSAPPTLMTPSEFVTPKTTKLDGRQRNASAEVST